MWALFLSFTSGGGGQDPHTQSAAQESSLFLYPTSVLAPRTKGERNWASTLVVCNHILSADHQFQHMPLPLKWKVVSIICKASFMKPALRDPCFFMELNTLL